MKKYLIFKYTIHHTYGPSDGISTVVKKGSTYAPISMVGVSGIGSGEFARIERWYYIPKFSDFYEFKEIPENMFYLENRIKQSTHLKLTDIKHYLLDEQEMKSLLVKIKLQQANYSGPEYINK